MNYREPHSCWFFNQMLRTRKSTPVVAPIPEGQGVESRYFKEKSEPSSIHVWYIAYCLHNWVIVGVNVGKYPQKYINMPYMEPLGDRDTIYLEKFASDMAESALFPTQLSNEETQAHLKVRISCLKLVFKNSSWSHYFKQMQFMTIRSFYLSWWFIVILYPLMGECGQPTSDNMMRFTIAVSPFHDQTVTRVQTHQTPSSFTFVAQNLCPLKSSHLGCNKNRPAAASVPKGVSLSDIAVGNHSDVDNRPWTPGGLRIAFLRVGSNKSCKFFHFHFSFSNKFGSITWLIHIYFISFESFASFHFSFPTCKRPSLGRPNTRHSCWTTEKDLLVDVDGRYLPGL